MGSGDGSHMTDGEMPHRSRARIRGSLDACTIARDTVTWHRGPSAKSKHRRCDDARRRETKEQRLGYTRQQASRVCLAAPIKATAVISVW